MNVVPACIHSKHALHHLFLQLPTILKFASSIAFPCLVFVVWWAWLNIKFATTHSFPSNLSKCDLVLCCTSKVNIKFPCNLSTSDRLCYCQAWTNIVYLVYQNRINITSYKLTSLSSLNVYFIKYFKYCWLAIQIWRYNWFKIYANRKINPRISLVLLLYDMASRQACD